MDEGGGNHRGSIFRQHVGAALIARSHGRLSTASWGIGQSADAQVRKSEATLEREVSSYIGQMSILWVGIADSAGPASDRAFIERNAIGLVAGPTGPIDRASEDWLGNFSPNEAIRDSALWNVNHVRHACHREFLEVFREYVDITIRGGSVPTRSIAPHGWHTTRGGNQLALFER